MAKKTAKKVSAVKAKKTGKSKKATKKVVPKRVPIKKAAPKRAAPKRAPATKDVAAPKPKVSKKKAPAGSGIKGYTPAQYEKFCAQKKRLFDMNNQTLKDILKKNLTSMTGNKDDLVFKVADGIVLGRIPRCPKCFGGRPKFDYKAGTYYCSGYRDDEDFHNCQTLYQLDEIKRETWEP